MSIAVDFHVNLIPVRARGRVLKIKRDLSGTVANYITTKQPTVFILENVCGFKQGRQKVEGGENKSEMVGFFDFLT